MEDSRRESGDEGVSRCCVCGETSERLYSRVRRLRTSCFGFSPLDGARHKDGKKLWLSNVGAARWCRKEKAALDCVV